MSHFITGFAGPFDPLAASAGLGGRPVARLGCGWGFLPVEPAGTSPDPAFPMFRHLTPGLTLQR